MIIDAFWEYTGRPRLTSGLSLVDQEIASVEAWINRGLYKLELLLANHAEFQRLYPEGDE